MTRRYQLLFVLALTLLAGVAPATAQQLDNGIWAIVNAKVITKYQVEMNAKPAVDLIIRQYSGKPELRQKIYEAYTNSLKQLIDREMIAHDFEASGFRLPEPIVEDYVRNRVKEQFGDRTEFIKTLKAEGKSFEKYKEEARQRIIVGALEEKNVGRATIVSPLKLERYYEQRKEEFKLPDQIHLRVIVLDSSSAPTLEARHKLAEEIRAQIVGGTAFAEMATVYSTGSQRAQGGDWGWADRTTLRKDMADVAFNLEPKQVSAVVEASDGTYLFWVEEKRSAHYKTLAEADVRDKLEKELLLEERKRLQERYVKKLEDKTFVRTY
jgi:peptidyl-prolyl cis-trans isomerase SurA